MTGPPAAALAEQLARIAHAGQVDKQGLPYIDHVARVAASVFTDVCATVPDTGPAVAAAWLHDVLEDTPTTAADLLAAGIPAAVVRIVEILTHEAQHPYEAYITRVAADPIATAVKLADLRDNLRPGWPVNAARYEATIRRLETSNS